VRYPVLYEAPFTYELWNGSINVSVVLDTLIDQGSIPPVIVVFINAYRAPLPDTQCADSVDGRQWMDTFISKTVVSAVDAHYPTVARPEGRAITGFSDGGYCSAILTLRHPDTFGTAIPISGYFWAGVGDASAALPFGGDTAALAAASPMIVATQLSAEARAKLFFIVVAKPSQPFFGVQSAEFEQMLQLEGYPYLAIDAEVPHGWEEVRQELPTALEAWAARLVAAGVF
jgi:enterochelin esterase-like enzyme